MDVKKKYKWLYLMTAISLGGCISGGEKSIPVPLPSSTQSQLSSIKEVIILEALVAMSRVNSVSIETSSSRDNALAKLRQTPNASIEAWQRAYDKTSFHTTRSSLIILLGELCLSQSARTLVDLASKPLPNDGGFQGHLMLNDRDRAEIIQTKAVQALGRISGPRCAELAPDPEFFKTTSNLTQSILHKWFFDADNSFRMRMLAGEVLLAEYPVFAAKLRARLTATDEWMLTPFKERRVYPKVEDSSPESKSQNESLDRPLLFISQSCRDRISQGWQTLASGDFTVAELIHLSPDTPNGLKSRYDEEINFQNNTWDEGFGWNFWTTNSKPFKRAINSFWLIENASTNPNPPGDYSGGVINWAWDYIKRKTPEFEGSCSSSALATTTRCSWPGWFCDNRIQLKLPLWSRSVSVRAGTIIHEARHADGYRHNAGSSCPRGGGCDSRYSYRGANTLQIQWLAQFYRNGRNSYGIMKSSALDRANFILRNGYKICPNVQLDNGGWFYQTPNVCG